MKRTYVDKVIYHEVRVGYRFTMDAFVVSHRSDRGRKYAYTYIDMGPSGYFEGFTLVLILTRAKADYEDTQLGSLNPSTSDGYRERGCVA